MNRVDRAEMNLATLLSSRGQYDRIGRGDLTFDRDASAPAPVSDPYRDDEIRQLLEARNARRACRRTTGTIARWLPLRRFSNPLGVALF